MVDGACRKANKTACVQRRASADNVALPVFAAERRAAAARCGAAAAAAGRSPPSVESIRSASTALSSKPAARRCCGRAMGQTDRQTPDCYTDSAAHTNTRSTQPCIPPGSLNRAPASAGVRAGMSPLPGGRLDCELLYPYKKVKVAHTRLPSVGFWS